ncbi:MAG: hypothetical protein KDD43_11270, partial [Bdellovibrionales bacterium]|nr:hypothetical protein [Bdellovibrionales bacterium]
MERGVVINGVKWEPRDGANYYCDYGKVYRDACSGMAADALGLYREMLLNDLWFFLHFGLGCGWANHPFIVERCFEVQFGPRTNTLDLWAREHGKTFVLTIAESLQETLRAYVLDLRDETTAIFCYNLKLSQKILNTMKRIFEDNEFLKVCFPDVLYTQPQTESPSWSEDKGLMLKRHSSALKEATFEAHGLIESLPTGPHFGRRVYDDVETEKVAASSDLSQKVKDNFDLSENLGVDGGTQRVLGTYYRHDGPLMYIRDKTDPENGEPIFHTRVYPATEDGSFFGKPVYLSPQRMRILRSNRFTYNCQQLLNPMPQEEQELRAEMLKEVDVRLIPSHLYKFMLVDPAGRKKKKKSDRWAIGLFGVNPFLDDVGCSDVYILDLFIKQCDMSEALTKFVDMYSRAGRVLR